MLHDVALVGFDIAKSIFHVHAADREGRGLLRRQLKREDVEPFFRALPACRIGLEACPGAHHWGRLLRSMGHDVRLLPAQYVRPYVKTNKNDAANAEAICEAMTRPTMRFVPIKEAVQQEVLVAHRVQELLIRQRTSSSTPSVVTWPSSVWSAPNARTGSACSRQSSRTRPTRACRRWRDGRSCIWSPSCARWPGGPRIDEDFTEIARRVETCRRLMTLRGIGVITATALAASMRNPSDFKSGRHFAAWLGLVPKRNSTGGVDKLGGISKRGDGYLRRLPIHGSRSVMGWRGKAWTSLAKLRGRRPANVAVVAIANKTARIVWAMLKHGGVYGAPAPRMA